MERKKIVSSGKKNKNKTKTHFFIVLMTFFGDIFEINQ